MVYETHTKLTFKYGCMFVLMGVCVCVCVCVSVCVCVTALGHESSAGLAGWWACWTPAGLGREPPTCTTCTEEDHDGEDDDEDDDEDDEGDEEEEKPAVQLQHK